MRIGIFTLPLHTNYGGILQAYALQTVLERLGHEVEVFDKSKKNISLSFIRRILSYTKRFCKKYILQKKNIVLDWVKFENKRRNLIAVNTNSFIKKYINIRELDSLQEIKEDDYDTIVVGSDQIWRQAYNKIWKDQHIDDVYLGFTKGWNIKRIAYAASFGRDEFELSKRTEIKRCRLALAQFNAVSIREESGVDICKHILNYPNATWMPDPTLLLTKEDYMKLIPGGKHSIEGNQLLSYILDETLDKAKLRAQIAKEKGLSINITNKADNYKEGEKIIAKSSVEDWLKSFVTSKYVITDSFHACVFSIIFHKQFTVIANKDRGLARFISLLKMFNLEDRLVLSPNKYKCLPDINYSVIDVSLNEWRKKAYAFLYKNLGFVN